jgi:hypothetical protein
MHSELNAKRLELLRSAFPKISTVAILFNPSNPAWKAYLGPIDAGTAPGGVFPGWRRLG